MTSIVLLDVSETVAPIPNGLQGRGAVISQGATTLGAGNWAPLTQDADLTPLLANPLATTSVVWAGGTVTVGTAVAIPGVEDGDTFITALAGILPAGYNGTVAATVTGANTFTFPLAANPGAVTQQGTYSPPNQGEVVAAVDTFFSQLKMQAAFVLELGSGDGITGPPALQAWIALNPKFFYAYAVPRLWDGQASFNALLALTQAPNGLTYYFVPTTLATYQNPSYAKKNVIALIEAPNLPLTEFDAAAFMQVMVSQNPSSTNKVTPYCYSYLFGVTPYPTKNNSALLQTLENANINVVGTGAEGGLPNSNLISGGTTGDGNDVSWWYNADWCMVNLDLNTAKAVINGSNDPENPLYYNQQGIDDLQNVCVATLQTGTSYGIVNGTIVRTELAASVFAQNVADGLYAGQCVVNAEPFLINAEENPNDYGQGIYRGLSCAVIPQRGFKQIIINLNVSNLIAAP
jgi:hypothetical protein